MSSTTTLATLVTIFKADVSDWQKHVNDVLATAKNIQKELEQTVGRVSNTFEQTLPKSIEASIVQPLQKAQAAAKASLPPIAHEVHNLEKLLEACGGDAEAAGHQLAQMAKRGVGPLAAEYAKLKRESFQAAQSAHFAGARAMGLAEGDDARGANSRSLRNSMFMLQQQESIRTRAKEGINTAVEGGMMIGRGVALSGMVDEQSIDRLLPKMLALQSAIDIGRGANNAMYGLSRLGATIQGGLLPLVTRASAATAVFSAAIYGTSYALGGLEHANQSAGLSLELTKTLLAGASFGYLDFTESSKLAADGQKALNSQMVSGAGMVQQYKDQRQALMGGLAQEISLLRDLSEASEQAFVSQRRGQLGQLGVRGSKLDAETGRMHGAFQTERIQREIAALKEEADAYGLSAEAKRKYYLEDNNATAAQRSQIAGLEKLIATKKAAEEATKAEQKAAEDAKREAERHQKDIERQQKHVMEEGKRLAESLRTPQEKLAAELEHIWKLFNAGAIDGDIAGRAIKKANDDATDKTKPKKEHHARASHTNLNRETAMLAIENFVIRRAGSPNIAGVPVVPAPTRFVMGGALPVPGIGVTTATGERTAIVPHHAKGETPEEKKLLDAMLALAGGMDENNRLLSSSKPLTLVPANFK